MKKRFIAGAICPTCQQLDKVVMYDEDGARWRECVSCGYKDKLNEQPEELQEVATRVNQPRKGEQPLSHEVKVKSIIGGPRTPS